MQQYLFDYTKVPDERCDFGITGHFVSEGLGLPIAAGCAGG